MLISILKMVESIMFIIIFLKQNAKEYQLCMVINFKHLIHILMVLIVGGGTVEDIFVEPDFTQSQLGIARSVCFDSDWRSPTRYEIESDHRTGINFAHCRANLII
jgi:hypothetical protein